MDIVERQSCAEEQMTHGGIVVMHNVVLRFPRREWPWPKRGRLLTKRGAGTGWPARPK
ncbi:hypothetical protein BC567DRAFT_229808 [Phyllosticta citribraziliensis]